MKNRQTAPERSGAKSAARPIAAAAYAAAIELRAARSSYDETLSEITYRLNRATNEVQKAGSYGNTMSAQAGTMIQELTNLNSRMRLDLLAKYAGEIDSATAVLKALRPNLTEEELAVLAQYEAL
jgi:hypothetical protein